jgi:hypothetical protein
MSTAELWAKRMTASFASGLSSGHTPTTPLHRAPCPVSCLGPCVHTALTGGTTDDDEEASRPTRPVRAAAQKPESDDDSGVEETFERARGEAQVTSCSCAHALFPYLTLQHRQKRSSGRQATKATGFGRNKESIVESLKNAKEVRVRA